MEPSRLHAAIAGAISCASELGLHAERATVLQDSNRVTARLLPCDTVVRVQPARTAPNASFELELARQLALTGSPVGAPEPRVTGEVYARDGVAITFWAHYPPQSQEVPLADYAGALERLHVGMRHVASSAPHFTDRVAEAQQLVADPALTPDLGPQDRQRLASSLRKLTGSILQRGRPEQLLHGEPHPGNLVNTNHGPLFIDLQTCCRGPVEFDVAHAPDEVAAHYLGIDPDVVARCRALKLAMVAAWRWDRDDTFPDGRQMGEDFVRQLRVEYACLGLDAIR